MSSRYLAQYEFIMEYYLFPDEVNVQCSGKTFRGDESVVYRFVFYWFGAFIALFYEFLITKTMRL